MQNLKEGQKVSINTDNWGDLGKHGTILELNPTHVVIVTEDGVNMTLSYNQVTPLTFLSEIENDGKNLL